MNRRIISTAEAPQPLGAYSQAIRIGDLVFVSGQLPIDAAGEIPEGIVSQTRLTMDNIFTLSEAGGCSPQSIAKITVYLANLSDLEKVNEVLKQMPWDEPPACTVVSVVTLPPGMLLEIDAIGGVDRS